MTPIVGVDQPWQLVDLCEELATLCRGSVAVPEVTTVTTVVRKVITVVVAGVTDCCWESDSSGVAGWRCMGKMEVSVISLCVCPADRS